MALDILLQVDGGGHRGIVLVAQGNAFADDAVAEARIDEKPPP